MFKFDGYTNTDNLTHAVELVVTDLGNGYDKYHVTVDGQRVQAGVVKSGKAQSELNKYCKRMGIIALFPVS